MYSPTPDEFLKLAERGNLIPVTRRILADFETPLSAYQKIRGQGESFLFESVEGGEHLGRYSFVGCNPRAIIRQTGNRVDLIENGAVVKQFLVSHATQTDASPDAKPAIAITAQGMNTYGKVEEVTVSCEAATGDQPKLPIVRDGLEVVEE